MIGKKRFLLFNFVFFVFLVSSTLIPLCASEDKNSKSSPADTEKYPLLIESEVKNIILFIGDGMGPVQVVAARIKHKGVQGRLSMERMPVTGQLDTFDAQGQVTDSSAAATAIATGFKTNSGMISTTPDGSEVMTIMEACRNYGKSTGLVVTCDITQSTPAAFATHVENRWHSPVIAEKYLDSRFNIIMGGGRSHFVPQSDPKSRRKDDLNLIEKFKSKGYTYIETKEEFNSASGKYILGLFQYDALKLDKSEPSIVEMTEKSIRLLNRNPKGFFLMVEGSQIDSYCHRHNTEMVLHTMGLFDDAVKLALEFASKDRKTLVIVTGDHEAGGMVIDGGSYRKKALDIKWVSRFHTGVPTPIFAFGPSADLFTGLLNNTDMPVIIAKLMKIKNFPAVLKKGKKLEKTDE